MKELTSRFAQVTFFLAYANTFKPEVSESKRSKAQEN